MELLSKLKADVREFFWLERLRARRAAVTPSQRAIVAAHLRAAERRLQFAPSLVGGDTAPVALTMARDAVVLLIRAVVAERTPAIDDEALRRLDAAAELTALCEGEPGAPPEWRSMIPFLSAGDPLELDVLPPAVQSALAAAFARTAEWLRRGLEPRSIARVGVMRWVSLAATAIVLVWAAVRVLSAPNLALHQPATQSSQWPGAAPSAVLVDGQRSGTVGPGSPDADYAHTAREATPWVMVDLGTTRTLREVRVYNRGDTNFDDGLPFTLELSEDAKNFEPVAERKTHFGSSWLDAPWTADVRGRRARFVRVRGTGYLALSELEAYGR